jgi:DNA-binding transcriptional ArsR family regulator
MPKGGTDEKRDPGLEQVLGHPARLRILLGLHSKGPISPSELSKSPLGKGIRVNVYSYHFKELERWGLLEVDQASKGEEVSTRYVSTNRLTRSMIDAAALDAISGVLAAIPESLAQWIDGPYIDDISIVVRAAGRSA